MDLVYTHNNGVFQQDSAPWYWAQVVQVEKHSGEFRQMARPDKSPVEALHEAFHEQVDQRPHSQDNTSQHVQVWAFPCRPLG